MSTTDTLTTLAPTETYAAAYRQLTTIAEKLRLAGSAADVDSLVQDLRAARAAYAVCRARLDAVRREVDAELEAASEAEA